MKIALVLYAACADPNDTFRNKNTYLKHSEKSCLLIARLGW